MAQPLRIGGLETAAGVQMLENARRCRGSADYREGREAFMAKRKPVFTGA